jgi:hypothetical protein
MAVERAQQIIDQVAKERERFIEWVRGVPDDVWANTSPDGTWQARDYVAHLAAIDPLLTAWFRSLQRERSEGGTGGGGRQRFDIDEWNEGQILERRSRAIDELFAEMEKHRVDLNAALAGFTDEQLDQTIHFGGDAKRSPRELPLHMFLSGWAYHDRWHMEDARRAIAGEPEQPFGDASFEQAMQGRGEP